MINYCSKALVSFGRIEDFLSRPEVALPPSSLPPSLPLGGIAIESASFRWGGVEDEEAEEGETLPPPILQGMFLRFTTRPSLPPSLPPSFSPSFARQDA